MIGATGNSTVLLLPESARIEVEPQLAKALHGAAESLPCYDSKDLYSLDLQAEIQDAVRRQAGEGYDHLIDEIREALGRAPHTALVSNLEFDDNHRLFVAINRAFGDLVSRPYQPPRAQLVHYIQPSTDISSTRGTVTESERLHTDSADWPDPVEIVSMVCVRPDSGGGGRSRILTVGGFRRDVGAKVGADAVERLESQPVPWQLADYHGADIVWQPVLHAGALRWRRYTIDAALSTEGVSLSKGMIDLLDEVDNAITESPNICEVLMGAGDFLITDNHRTLHSRTALSGDYETSGRLMIRSWVSNRSGNN